jgi:hypothetical protein
MHSVLCGVNRPGLSVLSNESLSTALQLKAYSIRAGRSRQSPRLELDYIVRTQLLPYKKFPK